MRPINDADRKVANIHTDAFEPFVYPDGLALGDGVLQLDTGIPLGTGFHVYKMPPGMTSRSHRHNGHEQFLILEGELHESDGRVLKAGDLVAEVIDPMAHRSERVCAGVDGVLYARIRDRYVTAGCELAKIAGTVAFKTGELLGA